MKTRVEAHVVPLSYWIPFPLPCQTHWFVTKLKVTIPKFISNFFFLQNERQPEKIYCTDRVMIMIIIFITVADRLASLYSHCDKNWAIFNYILTKTCECQGLYWAVLWFALTSRQKNKAYFVGVIIKKWQRDFKCRWCCSQAIRITRKRLKMLIWLSVNYLNIFVLNFLDTL